MTLFGYNLFTRAPSPSDSARNLGHLGGKARAAQLRQPIREMGRRLREECGLPEDRRLA